MLLCRLTTFACDFFLLLGASIPSEENSAATSRESAEVKVALDLLRLCTPTGPGRPSIIIFEELFRRSLLSAVSILSNLSVLSAVSHHMMGKSHTRLLHHLASARHSILHYWKYQWHLNNYFPNYMTVIVDMVHISCIASKVHLWGSRRRNRDSWPRYKLSAHTNYKLYTHENYNSRSVRTRSIRGNPRRRYFQG
jgi:hypothetical protein